MDANCKKLLAKAKNALSDLQKAVQQKLDDIDVETNDCSELEATVSQVNEAVDALDAVEE